MHHHHHHTENEDFKSSEVVGYIKDFKGEQFLRGSASYDEARYQYATSTYKDILAPASVLFPTSDQDVILAIRYAKEKNISIALRTGGHQFSGASSTCGDNIQLDLSRTYPEFEYNSTTGLVRMGVSHRLGELNAKLGEHGLFVPTGQCSHVSMGGHVQTGGYGALIRAFGIFTDHVQSIRVITADESILEVKRNSTSQRKKDLFYATLGGSPGNIAIITHMTLKPLRDIDHPHSRGLKIAYFYTKKLVKKFLDLLLTFDKLPADWDLCVSIVSSDFKTTSHFVKHFPSIFEHTESLDTKMRIYHSKYYGPSNHVDVEYPAIIIYLQWANLGGHDQPFGPTEEAVFSTIRNLSKLPIQTEITPTSPLPLSELSRHWIWFNVREYDLPYVKRSYRTNYTPEVLTQKKWSDWMSDSIDNLQKTSLLTHCKIVAQYQVCGGDSNLIKLANNETAFSWRDETVLGFTLDCFHHPDEASKAHAEKWQSDNDYYLIGENGNFAVKDMRSLWGSYGSLNLHSVWRFYFENEEKYERLVAIKQREDPDGIFTANAFCVGKTKYDDVPDF